MAVHLLKGPFTVDAYQRLAELGVLREDARVELIAGQVVEMSPIGDRHASCVRYLIRLLSRALGDVAIVDAQNPVVLDEHDAPQPDVAVLRLRGNRYSKHPRPEDILLIIEVADTTIAYDRDVKIPLYARAEIPEAWLVNLPANRLEIYRDPVEGTYRSVRIAARGDQVTPGLFPQTSLSVDDILG